MVSPPEGFAQPMYGLNFPKVPEGIAEFDLPPVELSRAGTVRGIVVDERGEPAAGAEIMAYWPVNEGPNARGRQERRAIAGRRGEFLIGGVVAEAPVDLSALAPDGRRTSRSVGSRAGAEPARLVLESSGSVSLVGRVVDVAGHRVAGAKVHLRVQLRYPTRQIKGDALVAIRGAYVIKTNDTGWYRTPPILDPELEYTAFVEADGFEPARTNWTPGKARTFPELALRPSASERVAAVEGTVRDRGGKPVVGATVWTTDEAGTPIRTKADAGGRFRIEGGRARRSLLFVEADGFRFFGRVIEPGTASVSIALTRSEERPTGSMTTMPPPLPRADERALSRRLVLPYVERILEEGGSGGWRSRALDALAYSEPARVLAIVEGGIPGTLRRLACARAMWEDGRAEALAVIESISAGEWRVRGHLQASRAIPAAERPARIDQVDRALEQVRAIADGDNRVRWFGEIAGRYLDLSEVKAGTELLRETLPAARALPKAGSGGLARGLFAEGLARVDPAAALELIEGIDGRPSIDKLRIDVIKGIAAIDPARAESLLATIEDPNAIADDLPALGYAMARKDPARARRLVDRTPEDRPDDRVRAFYRPYAIGMIALALADSDRARAAGFLDEAFAALKLLAAEGRSGSPETQDAATIAAALVPVAERIDPALVPEFFWRAASLGASSKPRVVAGAMRDATREARPGGVATQGARDAATREAVLALLLARYDRDAAMVLLAPLLDRWSPTDDDASTLARALAAVAPERAVALVESMPDDAGADPRGRGVPSVKDHARIELADFLGRPPGERWERVTRLLLDLWCVDD
jgi:hypothetical protein